MKKKDFKLKSSADLEKEVFSLKSQYLDKKLLVMNNALKDTSILSKLRKDTARIKTVLNERKNNE